MSDLGNGDSTLRKLANVLGYSLAGIASVATLVSLYFQLFDKPPPKIEARLTAVEPLTTKAAITGLSAEYKYQGRIVRDLWRVRLETVNAGKTTIIGRGNGRNIITDGIEMRVDPSFDLLSFELDPSSSSQIEAQRGDGNSLHFHTLQWRKGESIVVNLFMERSNTNQLIGPEAFVFNRCLQDGDIEVLAANAAKPSSQSMLDAISPALGKGFRWSLYLLFASVGFGTLGLMMIAFADFRKELKITSWRERYVNMALQHLKTKYPDRMPESYLTQLFDPKVPVLLKDPDSVTGDDMREAKKAKIELLPATEKWEGFRGVPPESIEWVFIAPKPWKSLVINLVTTVVTLLGLALFFASIIPA